MKQSVSRDHTIKDAKSSEPPEYEAITIKYKPECGVKMDTNPAYQCNVKMDTNPAYHALAS